VTNQERSLDSALDLPCMRAALPGNREEIGPGRFAGVEGSSGINLMPLQKLPSDSQGCCFLIQNQIGIDRIPSSLCLDSITIPRPSIDSSAFPGVQGDIGRRPMAEWFFCRRGDGSSR